MYDVIRITITDPKSAIESPELFALYSAHLERGLKQIFGDDLLFVHEIGKKDPAFHDTVAAVFSGISTGRHDAVVLAHAQTLRQATAKIVGVKL